MHKKLLIKLLIVLTTVSLHAQEAKELDLVFKSELNREFHTTIEGKGAITLNLTFSKEDLGVDECYSMHHAVRLISGWYSFDTNKDEKIVLSGGIFSWDTMYLYVGVDNLGESGIRCGKWIDYENGEEQEIGFTERFMFTGTGSGEWFDNKTTLSVNPIFSTQDDIVEKFIYVLMEDGTKFDLKPIIMDKHWDLLYSYSNLYYKKCFTNDNTINVLMVKYNEHSCWNEYQVMIHMSFDKNTLEVIDSKSYQISKCDKLASDFMESDHEDNKTYNVYAYGLEDDGEMDEALVGQFQIKEAKVRVMKKWF
jgi:hypothetical protein